MPRNGRCVNGRVAVFGLSGDVSGHKRPCTGVVATLLRAVTHLAASGLCSHTPGCEMAAQLITASNGPRRRRPSMPCPEARSTYRMRGRYNSHALVGLSQGMSLNAAHMRIDAWSGILLCQG